MSSLFSKPSAKRSMGAYKGQLKRHLKRAVNPYYGKRGTGWAHPKRAVYNRVHYRTTVNTRKVIKDAAIKHETSKDMSQPVKYHMPRLYLKYLIGGVVVTAFIGTWAVYAAIFLWFAFYVFEWVLYFMP